jgi:bla regulator protein BlaR1
MTMLILVLCVVSTATISGAVMLGNDSERTTIDNIDLPFIDDPDVIGTWVSVDFVKNISDFDPANKCWQGDLCLDEFIFLKNGEIFVKDVEMQEAVSYLGASWTKGIVLNKKMGTASKYEIKEINGSDYMFFEWKSGDYTIRHMTPYYYVFKFSSSKTIDNNITDTGILQDNTDIPFVDDADVISKWESVDFVKNISDFNPANKSWKEDLYLEEFIFSKNGEISVKAGDMQEAESYPKMTWTKGVVLYKNAGTASKYEIKDIDGSEYMFFEWKSGDYVIRHMTPYYYVLKKAD